MVARILGPSNLLNSRNVIASVVGNQWQPTTNRSLVLMPDACHVIGHRRWRGPTRTNAKVLHNLSYSKVFDETVVVFFP